MIIVHVKIQYRFIEFIFIGDDFFSVKNTIIVQVLTVYGLKINFMTVADF